MAISGISQLAMLPEGKQGRADPSGNPKNIQKHALPAALPPLLESKSQKEKVNHPRYT